MHELPVCVLFIDEEYLMTAQTVIGFEQKSLEDSTIVCLHPSHEDELLCKTHLVTGYEERCFEDAAALLSNSTS